MDENQERQHQKKKIIMRIIGSILIIVGAVCALIGFIDMSKSFKEGRMPMFWLFFIGFPSLAIGSFLVTVSFQRAIQRYVKNESVPVINEMGQEISPAFSAMAGAMHSAVQGKTCPDCGAVNDKDAQFCKSCGKALSIVCKHCGEVNNSDAKFCDKCGKPLNEDF